MSFSRFKKHIHISDSFLLITGDINGNYTLKDSVTGYCKRSEQDVSKAKPLIEFDETKDAVYIQLEKTIKEDLEKGLFIYKPVFFTSREKDTLPEGWGVSPKFREPNLNRRVYHDPEVDKIYYSIPEVEKAVAAKAAAKAAAAKAAAAKATA